MCQYVSSPSTALQKYLPSEALQFIRLCGELEARAVEARGTLEDPGTRLAGSDENNLITKIGKFCKILQIFGGLVLGCIKTKFCKKICV